MLTQLIRKIVGRTKPCGCSKAVGGTPWKKRLASEMKTHSGGGYRVEHVETVRECGDCGGMNLVRQSWAFPDHGPHPDWRDYSTIKGKNVTTNDTYDRLWTWQDPEDIEEHLRYDLMRGEPTVSYEAWGSTE